MVLDPCRREIEPDVVLLNAGFAALCSQSFVDLCDALTFESACESFTDGSDVHVFEVAEYSAGFEELEVCGDEFVNEYGGEVVEWKSGDDEVKGRGGVKLLQWQLVDGGLVSRFVPGGF